MSEQMEFQQRSGGTLDIAWVIKRGNDGLSIQVLSKNLGRRTSVAAVIDLPAADARRLRDWLRERYPEETTNG